MKSIINHPWSKLTAYGAILVILIFTINALVYNNIYHVLKHSFDRISEETYTLIYQVFEEADQQGSHIPSVKLAAFKKQHRFLMLSRDLSYFSVLVYGPLHISVSIVSIISSVITAILIFTITAKGWQNTSTYLRVAFFVFSASTATQGVFSKFMKTKENYENNRKLSRELLNIHIELFDFMLTADRYDEDDIIQKSDSMIHYLNQKIMLTNIKLGSTSLEEVSSDANDMQEMLNMLGKKSN